MIRKIVHIALWLVLGCWFTLIMGFVSKSNSELLCREIVINISDSSEVSFVTSDAIRKVIRNSGLNTQGYPLEEIRTRELETILEKNPYVKNAEVYTNVNGDLYVDISQRKPLIRVMPGGRQGFFIDGSGVILPLSDNYSPMVLLLTGYVTIPMTEDKNGRKKVDTEHNPDVKKLLGFAKMVDQHEFWRSQIVQLYRSKKGDYEMIPRVGAHQIQFGTMDDYEIKLRNLKLLYDQGLKQYGWNKYNKINLKYSNQIICTKR